MKKWLLRSFLVVLACAALGTIGPVQRVIAQGVVNLTSLAGTEQITGIGYPCVTSCYVTTKQIAQYAASQSAGVNAQTGTTYTVLASDAGKLVTFSNASAIAVTLPVATTSGFGAGTVFEFANIGAGAVTITPTTSTINGASTYVINQNRSIFLVSDGTNYQVSPGGGGFQVTPAAIAEGGTGSSTASAARTALAVPGTAITNTFTGTLNQFGSGSGTPSHLASGQTTAPALTSCGTGSPSISGSDTAGTVTMGTNATGCTITFNVAYTTAPHCTVTWRATPLASQSYTVSASALTLTQTSTSGNLADYTCIAPSGG